MAFSKSDGDRERRSLGTAITGVLPVLCVFLLALVVFAAPLFPDVKLTRPKLLLLETGLYGCLFLLLAAGFARGTLALRRSRLLVPLFFYGAAEALFYYFSPDRPIALNELKRSMLSLTAYVVMANAVFSDKSRTAVLFAWIGGSFLAVTYGLLQHTGGIFRLQVPLMERVMSTFGNPIFFAAHIVVTLSLAIGLFLTEKKRSVRAFLSLFILASLVALYYTRTRAAFIGFGVSLVVFALLGARSKKTRLVLLSAVLVVCGILAALTADIWSRQQAHLLIWRDTLVMWLHHPLFGTGPGTFHIYFPQYASAELRSIWPQESFIINDAHNEFVQYLGETGIAGFGIFLWLLAAFFANARRTVASAGRSGLLTAGMTASAAGLLVQNIFSVDMRFIVSSVYLFFVMGLVDTFTEAYRKKENLGLPVRAAGAAAVIAIAALVYPAVLQPYRAQKKVAATPDFFDVKILEPAKTIADLEAIAARYPDQSLVYDKLGWVYAKEKNWPKAIENLERASALNPKGAGPLNNLGNIYYLQGDKEKAIDCWVRSLAINPGQVDSRLNLALAYYYRGELKESAQHLKEVLKIDPKNEKAIVMLKQMTE